jgi:hypothetical protein
LSSSNGSLVKRGRGTGLLLAADWALQTLAVCLVSMAVVLVFAGWIDEPDGFFWDVVNDALCALIGLLLGVLIATQLPALTRCGRWVWTVPVIYLPFALVSDGGRGGSFVAMPMVACCVYSVVCAGAWQRREVPGS